MNNFDMTAAPLEIERKFLIRYPDLAALRAMPGYRVLQIEQTYLASGEDFPGGRVRRITAADGVRYVYTYKVRLSGMTRREYERDITAEEYAALLPHRTPRTVTILKDRHVFAYAGLIYELDVYDFWDDRATLEAEVPDEGTPIPIPPCVSLIREVTHDRSYNNSSLAASMYR